jgi:UDP-glucose 4-epimerase
LGTPTHLIRVAAMVASGKLPHINIFGVDYDTRDGTCIRDYIHVSDVSNAIAKAVEQGPQNTPYECLGSNTGYSVLEVLDAMEQVTGKKLERIISDRRTGDAVASVVDKLSNYATLTKSIEDMCLDQYKLELLL